MIAYCDASGVIHFGSRLPKGMLPVAQGKAKALRERVGVVARHAYDGKTLLVPGVPEAENQREGVDALMKFRDWIRPGFERAGLKV